MGDDGQPAEGGTQRSKLDITVISTLILFGLLLIKVYGVAAFSLETTGALAATQPVSVIVGTIALYSYLFVALIAVASIYVMFTCWKVDKSLRKWFWTATLPALLGILLTPYKYLIDSMVLLFMVLLISWASSARVRRQNSKLAAWVTVKSPIRTFHRTAMFLGALLVMLFFIGTLNQPWLPAETVKLRTPVTADLTATHPGWTTTYPVVFILGSDNGRVGLLFDSDRDIIYTNQGNIQSQRICNLNNEPAGGIPTVLQLILHQPFQAHVISCWRCTDQYIERNKLNPPLLIGWLEWQWAPVDYGRKSTATHKNCTSSAS
jgi:hypothetical protein